MSSFVDPVELARAEIGIELDPAIPGTHSQTDERIIQRLHRQADEHNFAGSKYWVETDQALVLPVDISDFDGRVGDLRDVDIAGVLAGYNKFSIGKRMAAWCLRFQGSVLAPDFDKISEEFELWVPIISVRTIEIL